MNAAEAAAQEYLQFDDRNALAGDADYDALHLTAQSTLPARRRTPGYTESQW